MADEEKAQGEDIVLIDEKKNKKRLPLWIAAIAVVEIVAAIALVQVLTPSEGQEDASDWEASASAVEREVEDVIVNLMDDGAKRILRVKISFRALAQDSDAATEALNRPGVVEDKLITLLSRKHLADVLGKQEQLKEEIITMLNRDVLTEEWRKKNGQAKVVEILMPAIIIQ
jgi:flagellar basal body-associated protein FliL